MNKILRSLPIALTVATTILLIQATAPALALCKPGSPHCIKQGPGLGHFGNTVGNAGDCVGTTNDTCGLKTHAYAKGGRSQAVSTNMHPSGSSGTHK
ncbi:MAG TPA: hypothetical protein VMA30_21740 [Xanthobacteraceae bacterium]|nr:hypothetical protein [Xanthobacteraceae bacterium]